MSVALSVLAACGTGGTTNADTASTGSGAAQTEPPRPAITTSAITPRTQTAAVTTAITTIDGKTLEIPAGRPVAVFFFSVNCGSCAGGVKSLGEAARLAEQAGIQADFLAADMDPSESTQTILKFLDYTDAQNVPAAIDTGAVLTRRFKVAALSTLIVIDATGTVTYRGTDPSAERIIAALDEAAIPA
ncbi:TlpA family protein disulfide reductase [Sporichthya polymorpha]|uniref:TlpA family protein disulfide reductase n=1 Tax=Sporichthya polymorpha TaxID=35751 RepID=UPI001FE21E96|nr:redoxin family protein [Sporichthya polymorpha]